MKIAIVHEYMMKIGGAEKVLLSLCKAYPDAPIYTLIYDEERTKHLFKDREIITSSLQQKPAILRKNNKYLLPFLCQAVEEFDLSEYDVVLSSSNSYAHGVITKPSTLHLCYCHSPMRYIWDWHSEYLEENHIRYGLKGLFVRILLHKTRIWDYAASKRVDKWIANSKNVAERIKKYYGQDSVIINPPVNFDNIELSTDLPDDYYLIISRLEPYKKIELAIAAFNQTGKPLVIIGEGSYRNHLEKIAAKNIEFLGWQSDKSVHEYLKNSRALIFPGEDDFGITPVESMAAGRPVIAFGKGGAVETVIPGKTGYLFDEETPESLIKSIEKLEKNYIYFIPADIRKQAEKFSESSFIEKINSLITKYHG